MTNQEFRAVLDWHMCSDPWPVEPDGEGNQATITAWLNREAQERGFDSWVDAYHERGKEECGSPIQFDPALKAAELEREKDQAYHERNQLVLALSKCFPSCLGRHPEGEEWEEDWKNIVFVMLPTGQASWHIHDSELPLFEHLLTSASIHWDGHSNEEKYRRLAALKGGGVFHEVHGTLEVKGGDPVEQTEKP